MLPILLENPEPLFLAIDALDKAGQSEAEESLYEHMTRLDPETGPRAQLAKAFNLNWKRMQRLKAAEEANLVRYVYCTGSTLPNLATGLFSYLANRTVFRDKNTALEMLATYLETEPVTFLATIDLSKVEGWDDNDMATAECWNTPIQPHLLDVAIYWRTDKGMAYGDIVFDVEQVDATSSEQPTQAQQSLLED